MTSKPIYLIDQGAAKVAVLDVYFRDDHYEGTIALESTPPQLRELFERFEEVVEGQMFSLLDDIEDRIGTVRLRVRFDDGGEANVVDLQVFPSTNAVSFKIRQPVTVR
jgi:tRNA A-37 threonylcarbamoyl transferase component Bud32